MLLWPWPDYNYTVNQLGNSNSSLIGQYFGGGDLWRFMVHLEGSVAFLSLNWRLIWPNLPNWHLIKSGPVSPKRDDWPQGTTSQSSALFSLLFPYPVFFVFHRFYRFEEANWNLPAGQNHPLQPNQWLTIFQRIIIHHINKFIILNIL